APPVAATSRGARTSVSPRPSPRPEPRPGWTGGSRATDMAALYPPAGSHRPEATGRKPPAGGRWSRGRGRAVGRRGGRLGQDRRRGAEPEGLRAQDRPGAPHVALLRPDVPDGEPEDVASAEEGVREEDLSRGVHRLEQPLAQRVE